MYYFNVLFCHKTITLSWFTHFCGNILLLQHSHYFCHFWGWKIPFSNFFTCYSVQSGNLSYHHDDRVLYRLCLFIVQSLQTESDQQAWHWKVFSLMHCHHCLCHHCDCPCVVFFIISLIVIAVVITSVLSSWSTIIVMNWWKQGGWYEHFTTIMI